MTHHQGWLLAACVVLCGCNHQSPESIDAADSPDAAPATLPTALKEVSLTQSQGLKGATCTVSAAYNYPGKTEFEPVEGAKLIGVRVEFRDWKKGFDLDDVDILDAAGDQNHGSDPLIQFLTEQGDFIDDNDPDFDDEGPLHCLLIYPVPQSCTAIKLGYWGNVLTPAVSLEATGPVRPESSEKVLQFAKRDSPHELFERYLIHLEATGWPRSALPDWISLSYDQGDTIARGDAEAWVETDPQLKVVGSEIAGKPYYLRTRYFLIEVWVPHGKTPEYFGALRTQRVRLPATKEFGIPSATLAALDAAERNPYAAHRRKNSANGKP